MAQKLTHQPTDAIGLEISMIGPNYRGDETPVIVFKLGDSRAEDKDSVLIRSSIFKEQLI